MSFDKNKIRDMEYDPGRKRYIGKDGSELKVTPFSDGSGYKYDYYPSSTYNNEKHDSVHVKSDISGNWEKTVNDTTAGTQEKSSGSGCFLTSACMKYFQENFDDNCYELTILRWFRDNFVSQENKEHYYEVAPSIVDAINNEKYVDMIYKYIYENVVKYCVKKIENKKYDEAYSRYKISILSLEEKYLDKTLGNKLIKAIN